MKKTLLYSLFMLALAFTACEPIENRDSIGGAITPDQLNVTASPIVVNGKNGNMVVIENKSAVNPKWLVGSAVSYKAYDTLMIVSTGNIPVTFTGLNADGTQINKSFTIKIDTLSTLPQEYKYLFGDPAAGVTSKKYVWDETSDGCWGNGGYLGNSAPGWWKVHLSDVNGQDAVYGADGYMVFTLGGLKLTKSNAAGTTKETGTVALDLSWVKKDDNGSVWSKGKLNTTNVTVLMGKQPNNANQPVNSYQILKLNDSKLVLAFPEGGDNAGSWSTAWFWMFKTAAN